MWILFFNFMCKSLQILVADGAVSKVSYLLTVQYSFPNHMWKQHFIQILVLKLSKGKTILKPRDLLGPSLVLSGGKRLLIVWIFYPARKVFRYSPRPFFPSPPLPLSPSPQQKSKLDNGLIGKGFLMLILFFFLTIPYLDLYTHSKRGRGERNVKCILKYD